MAVLKLFYLVVLISGPGKLLSQNLVGKVIYISPTQQVMITFRSEISQAKFQVPEHGVYFERQVIDKSITIYSKVKDFSTTYISVTEGGNTHQFQLVYKEALDGKEMFYDYSTKKLLSSAVNEQNKINQQKAQAATTSTSSSTAVSPVQVTPIGTATAEPVVNSKLTQKDIEDKYNTIKELGNKAFNQNKYDEARELFKNALELKPGDTWCQYMLKRIDDKESAELLKKQIEAKENIYQSHIRSADSAMALKSYTHARFGYEQALKEKPGDFYAKDKLARIKADELNSEYVTYMEIGRDALQDQMYDEAVMAFDEALKRKPGDAAAINEKKKINTAKATAEKKQKEELTKTENRQRYYDTLGLGDNFFTAGLYAEARIRYVNAEKMRPGEARVKARIAEIDEILQKQKNVKNKSRQDSLNHSQYLKEIEKADRYFAGKDYAKAKTAFQMAQKLAPGEKYAGEKLAEINQIQEQASALKKQAESQKAIEDKKNKDYAFALKQGNTAFNAKNYQIAQEYFLQANELKPDEKLPLARLAEIESKLELIQDNARYEYLIKSADSLAWVVKDYRRALRFYDSASKLKPAETYPKKQTIAVNQILYDQDVQLTTEKRAELFNKAKEDFTIAERFRLERNFDGAQKYYSSFLAKADSLNIDEYTTNELYYINSAKDYLQRLVSYKSNTEAAKTETPVETEKKGKKKKNKKD